MLKQLISVCTPEVLIELLKLGSLEITYELTQSCIYSPNKNAKDDAYLPMAIAAHGHELDRLLPKIIRETDISPRAKTTFSRSADTDD